MTKEKEKDKVIEIDDNDCTIGIQTNGLSSNGNIGTNTPTPASYTELFEKFCTSSTIHGTYFWFASGSSTAKVIWGFIVLFGIVFSAIVINNSFEEWKKHPIMTNVRQAPVEEVDMPSLTICSMDDNRFGYIEEQLNKDEGSSNQTEEILSKIVDTFLHERPPMPTLSKCLLDQCKIWEEELSFLQDIKQYMDTESEELPSGKSGIDQNCKMEVCPNMEEFREFFNSVHVALQKEQDHSKANVYQEFISTQFHKANFIKRHKSEDNDKPYAGKQDKCNPSTSVSCQELVADFELLRMSKDLIQPLSDLSEKRIKGSLLRMLLKVRHGSVEELLTKYVSYEKGNDQFNSTFWLNDPESELNGLPLHKLIALFSRKDHVYSSSTNKGKVKVKMTKRQLERLQPILKRSINPPHVIEEVNGKQQMGLNPTFPFCFYGAEGQVEGLKTTKSKTYGESFCNAFQTTFNEVGVCYTINNLEQGFYLNEKGESNNINPVLKVAGCGKNKGLQIVLDSHRLSSFMPEGKLSKGFKVFLTLPGVTTSKMPFLINPTFKGEHNLILHGVHDVKATDDFKNWNDDAGACYFRNDKNLTYFKFYTQDNCLLECRMKKVARKCGCSPWYLKHEGLDVCTEEGNGCISQHLNLYSDELKDRTDPECDCKNDCQLVHFFTTMEKQEFDPHMTRPQHWFDKGDETRPPSGILANYLLDPEDVFTNQLIKNLTKLSLNLQRDVDLAQKRFDEDIAILNIFFDTPYLIHVSLETRTSIYDKISAIGGTLGLFTGISVITLAEIIYWTARFMTKAFCGSKENQETSTTPICWMDKEKDEAKDDKMPVNTPFGSEKGLIKITSPKPRFLM